MVETGLHFAQPIWLWGLLAVPLVLAWLLMLVWSIAVQAHIFRHALSTAYGSGLLLAGLHTVLIVTLV